MIKKDVIPVEDFLKHYTMHWLDASGRDQTTVGASSLGVALRNPFPFRDAVRCGGVDSIGHS